MSIDPSAQFSLSVQSISKLKYTARQSPEAGLKATAQQFEALFLQNMLERMRAAMPESGLLQSNQTEMYRALMDRQWAQTLAERGIGLADMMIEQLDRFVPDTGDANAGKADGSAASKAGAEAVAGIPLADPRALAPSKPASEIAAENAANTGRNDKAAQIDTPEVRPPLMAAQRDAGPLVAFAGGTQPLFNAPAAPSVSYAEQLDLLPEHVAAFLNRMGPAAHAASRQTGIPGQLILAQAALETGWGRHEIRSEDGRPSFNVFNIKATGWDGDSARVPTIEFANGQAHQTRADFRVYDSYDAAFADYARLLTESPRYAPVLSAPTADAAARQLQACGYATDPKYADKLISIMSQIPEPARRAPAPLFGGQSGGGLFEVAAAPVDSAQGGRVPADQTRADSGRLHVVQAYSALNPGADNPLQRIF